MANAVAGWVRQDFRAGSVSLPRPDPSASTHRPRRPLQDGEGARPPVRLPPRSTGNTSGRAQAMGLHQPRYSVTTLTTDPEFDLFFMTNRFAHQQRWGRRSIPRLTPGQRKPKQQSSEGSALAPGLPHLLYVEQGLAQHPVAYRPGRFLGRHTEMSFL